MPGGVVSQKPPPPPSALPASGGCRQPCGSGASLSRCLTALEARVCRAPSAVSSSCPVPCFPGSQLPLLLQDLPIAGLVKGRKPRCLPLSPLKLGHGISQRVPTEDEGGW